jgi:adenine/guanine phosphoribosyltransferase-like PRPP-binding protein
MASFAPGMALAAIVAPEIPKYREYNARTEQSEEQKEAGYQPRLVGCDYLDDFLNPVTLKWKAELAMKVLNGYGPFKKLEFDAIAFSGQSGSLIAPIVAMLMGKSLIVVRKRGVRSHSSYIVEGDRAAKSYLILDDLTSSGQTIEYIQESLRDEGWKHCEYIGMLGVGGLTEKLIDIHEKAYYRDGAYKHYPLHHTPAMQEERRLDRERRDRQAEEMRIEMQRENERIRAEREAQGIVEETPEPAGAMFDSYPTFFDYLSKPSPIVWTGFTTGPGPNEVIRVRKTDKQPDGEVTTVDTNFDPVPSY